MIQKGTNDVTCLTGHGKRKPTCVLYDPVTLHEPRQAFSAKNGLFAKALTDQKNKKTFPVAFQFSTAFWQMLNSVA